ncbi:MAG TPA: hypothetical protein DEQ40_08430 [Oxalobacteraceae bacterium]|nr:hypothetical protein [Oxalobacteraceae bacterium]
MKPLTTSIVEKIVKFSSVSVLPVLAFIGIYMFNGLDSIKASQANWTAHIQILEQTLPYLNDGVKRDSRRIDALEQNMMSRAPGVDNGARAKADARRDAQIKHLQEVIKELTSHSSDQHAEADPSLVRAQNELASLILN